MTALRSFVPSTTQRGREHPMEGGSGEAERSNQRLALILLFSSFQIRLMCIDNLDVSCSRRCHGIYVNALHVITSKFS